MRTSSYWNDMRMFIVSGRLVIDGNANLRMFVESTVLFSCLHKSSIFMWIIFAADSENYIVATFPIFRVRVCHSLQTSLQTDRLSMHGPKSVYCYHHAAAIRPRKVCPQSSHRNMLLLSSPPCQHVPVVLGNKILCAKVVSLHDIRNSLPNGIISRDIRSQRMSQFISQMRNTLYTSSNPPHCIAITFTVCRWVCVESLAI